MWYVGINIHKRAVVMSAVNDSGEVVLPVTIECRSTEAILEFRKPLKPFRAVVELSSTYRWLYDLISNEGTVLLAHPAKAVCEWMGNSIDVANEHYLQVTDQHFENALQFRVIEKGPNLRPERDITGQNREESGNIEKTATSKQISNEPTIQASAEPCGVKKESSEKRLLSSSSPARI